MAEPRHPTARLQIAFLTPLLGNGGAERQMLILAAELPKDSFEVRFLLLSERGPGAAQAEAAGAGVHVLGLGQPGRMPVTPRGLLAAVRAARQYRRLTADVDVVDAWLNPSMIFAATIQSIARVPVLIGGRRNLGDLYKHKSWLRRSMTTLAVRRMHAIVANSRAAAAEAVTLDGAAQSRVYCIPNAVLPAVGGQDREARRAAWGFSDDHLVIGCVANYKPEKGLTSLLEAAAALRTSNPSLRYVLVGEGSLRAHLEAEIRRLDLGTVVRLHGAADDARSLYASFDIYVQSSVTEGLPNVVLEAAAAGLPIIATAVGGTAEILTAGRDGILLEPSDPVALALAIEDLAADPALRTRLGDAARTRSADFTSRRLVEATASLYQRLARPRLGGRVSPPGAERLGGADS